MLHFKSTKGVHFQNNKMNKPLNKEMIPAMIKGEPYSEGYHYGFRNALFRMESTREGFKQDCEGIDFTQSDSDIVETIIALTNKWFNIGDKK